jgi:hypothetical protein
VATAVRIREAVREGSGITVSIGGGTNRLVAKLAAGRAKPHRTPAANGVIVVRRAKAAFLATFDLADIPGVGPRFNELAALGMRPCATRCARPATLPLAGRARGRLAAHRIRVGIGRRRAARGGVVAATDPAEDLDDLETCGRSCCGSPTARRPTCGQAVPGAHDRRPHHRDFRAGRCTLRTPSARTARSPGSR